MAVVYWIHAPHHTDMFSEGYIGFSSRKAEERFQDHINISRSSCKKYPVHNAIRKYGDEIVFRVLVDGSDEYCIELEEKLRPYHRIGWNLDKGGRVGSRGRVTSEETKEKQRLKKLGVKQSESHCAAKARSKLGTKMDSSVKEKISIANKGKVRTQEMRDNLSAALKGRVPSEETKMKLRLKKQSEPWTASKKKESWLLAECIFRFIEEGKTQAEINKIYNVRKGTLRTIFLRIKSGWVPFEDPLWLNFKEKYKENNGT